MIFNAGEHVVYGGSGICRIEGVEKRSFDGIEENDYYKLIPVNSESSVYYIPAGSVGDKVRKLLTRDEVYELIDSMPDVQPVWNDNNNERRTMFSSMLKSSDYKNLICLIKSLHFREIERTKSGKKLSVFEETAMRSAESIMHQEFSMVLGIPQKEVVGFITERIEKKTV